MSEGFVIRNEFSHVFVKLDLSANGMRLMVKDIRTGKVIYLDPLELESLAWSTHGDLRHVLDPSLTRWKDSQKSDGNKINE